MILSITRLCLLCVLVVSCGSLPPEQDEDFLLEEEKKPLVSSPDPAPTPVIVEESIKTLPSRKIVKKSYKKGFKEVAKEIGLENVQAIRLYAVDWSGDGATDLVVLPDHYSVPVFYRYDKFEEIFIKTERQAFDQSLRASYLTFADFNKDGRLDVIVATLNQKTELTKEPLRLFLARKGKREGAIFKEVIDAFPNNKMPVAAITLIDMNMDGLLDVYVANWYDNRQERLKLVPDRFFLAQKGGTKFVDQSAYLEKEHNYNNDLKRHTHATPSFGSSQCDLDQNGYPDVLVASSSGYNNKAWMNLRERRSKLRTFRDMGRKIGLAADKEGSNFINGGGNSFYMLCSDYNQDGLIDVAVGELFHSYDTETKDRSAILSGATPNFPPKFIRTEYHKDDGSGTWSQGDRRAIWLDVNMDSYVDLLVENSGFPPKSRLIFFEQGHDHSFADEAPRYGIDIINPSGMVTMDFDRDGRPDLISGQNNIRYSGLQTKLHAFKNDFVHKKTRVLHVVLRGKRANYHGLGASVFLKTNNKTYYQNVDYAQGALPSQNEEGLWYALGVDETPEHIEVRWPYLVKDRTGRQYPLRIKYRLSAQALRKGISYLKLFDNGKMSIKGKRP